MVPKVVVHVHALLGRGDMLEQVGEVFSGDDFGMERPLQSGLLLLELVRINLLGHYARAQSEYARHGSSSFPDLGVPVHDLLIRVFFLGVVTLVQYEEVDLLQGKICVIEYVQENLVNLKRKSKYDLLKGSPFLHNSHSP